MTVVSLISVGVRTCVREDFQELCRRGRGQLSLVRDNRGTTGGDAGSLSERRR